MLLPLAAQAQYDATGRKIAEDPTPTPISLPEVLPNINKSSLINGGKYAVSRTLLSRRVFDSNAKAVGEVKDVYVTTEGQLFAVQTSFAKSHLDGEVALEPLADGLKGTSKGYQLPLAAADIKTVFPDLIARTTENPLKASGAMSSTKLAGLPLNSSGGQSVGRIKEIIFDANGERVDLVLLNVMYGKIRNKTVVVPFGMINFTVDGSRIDAVAADEDLKEVFRFIIQREKAKR